MSQGAPASAPWQGGGVKRGGGDQANLSQEPPDLNSPCEKERNVREVGARANSRVSRKEVRVASRVSNGAANLMGAEQLALIPALAKGAGQ